MLVWQSYKLAWINKTAVDAHTLRIADAETNRIKAVKGVWACLGDISASVNPSAFTVQVVGWTNEEVNLRFGCDAPGASARGNYLVWVVGTA